MRISGNVIESLNSSTINADQTNSTNDNVIFSDIFTTSSVSRSENSTYKTLDKITSNTTDKSKNDNSYDNSKDKQIQKNKDKQAQKDRQIEKDRQRDKVKEKSEKELEESQDELNEAKKNEIYNQLATFLGIDVQDLQSKVQDLGFSENMLSSMEGIRDTLVQLTRQDNALGLLKLDGIKELFQSLDKVLDLSLEDAENILSKLKNIDLTDVKSNVDNLTELSDEIENLSKNAGNEKLNSSQNQTDLSDELLNDLNLESTESQEIREKLALGNGNEELTLNNDNEKLTEEATGEVTYEVKNKVIEVMEEINEDGLESEKVAETLQSMSEGQMGNGSQGGTNSQNQNSNSQTIDIATNIMFTQDAKSQVSTFNSIMNNRLTQNINQQDVINQIVEKMQFNIDGDTSEVRITLNPEHLGDVTLKIATHNGVVTAQFLAENEHIKSLIEAHFQDLQETLRQKGLEVSDFTTGLLSDNQEENSNRDNRKSRNLKRSLNSLDGDMIEEEIEEEIKISNYDYKA